MKKTHLYIAAAGLALAAPVNAQTVNPPPAPQAPAAQVQAPTAPVQAPGGLPSANQFGVGPTLMPSVVVTATCPCRKSYPDGQRRSSRIRFRRDGRCSEIFRGAGHVVA